MSSLLLVALPATGLAYVLLAVLVGGESAGVPLPGETALVAAGILASRGDLSIVLVVAVAAAAAIVGDNFGYLLGRKGARRLLERPGRLEDVRRGFLEKGEAFFQRHGPKTVFLGRWLPFLRITAAWLAGANRMHWATFVFWNAAGGIAWATTVGLVAYFLGEAAFAALHTAGLIGLAVVAIGAIVVFAWLRFRR